MKLESHFDVGDRIWYEAGRGNPLPGEIVRVHATWDSRMIPEYRYDAYMYGSQELWHRIDPQYMKMNEE